MSEASSDPQIIGNFRILSYIATGQTTQVLEVVDSASNERMAMKLLLPEAFKVGENKAALKHEANALKSFEHPNIIRFRGYVTEKTRAFLLMELFKAPNLKVQLQADLLGVQLRIRRIVEQVSLALGHIHEHNWIHRDIKPDNILCTKAGELKVCDLSLSEKQTSAFAAMISGKKKVQGTRTYMAPEQIRGARLVPQTDIYNFGITLFEILTGKTPFQGFSPNDLLLKHLSAAPPPPSSINSNVSSEMDRLVLKMLMKKPEQRHRTMAEVISEFRAVNPFKEPIEQLIEKKQEAESSEVSENDPNVIQAKRALGKSKKVTPATAAQATPALQSPAQPQQPAAPQRGPMPMQPQMPPMGMPGWNPMMPQPMMPQPMMPGMAPMGMPGVPFSPGMPPQMPMGMPGMPYAPGPGMPPNVAAGMPGAMSPGMAPPAPGMPPQARPQPVPAQPAPQPVAPRPMPPGVGGARPAVPPAGPPGVGQPAVPKPPGTGGPPGVARPMAPPPGVSAPRGPAPQVPVAPTKPAAQQPTETPTNLDDFMVS